MRSITREQMDEMVDALFGAKQIAAVVAETAMCVHRKTPEGPWELTLQEGDRLTYFASELQEVVERMERLSHAMIDMGGMRHPAPETPS
jgi:hypothetical protein